MTLLTELSAKTSRYMVCEVSLQQITELCAVPTRFSNSQLENLAHLLVVGPGFETYSAKHKKLLCMGISS